MMEQYSHVLKSWRMSCEVICAPRYDPGSSIWNTPKEAERTNWKPHPLQTLCNKKTIYGTLPLNWPPCFTKHLIKALKNTDKSACFSFLLLIELLTISFGMDHGRLKSLLIKKQVSISNLINNFFFYSHYLIFCE